MDIAQLVMYNISLKHNLKYFSLEEINNFLKSNWDDLQTQNVSFHFLKKEYCSY